MPRAAAVAIAALCAAARVAHDHRPMELFSVTYMGVNFAAVSGNRLPLIRGVAADLVANGDLVNTSTSVEVKTSGGQTAAGITATIVARSDSLSSGCNGASCAHLIIRVTSTSAAALGNYTVLIHYLVEFAGPEKFDLSLFDRGHVSSAAITSTPLADGSFRVGDNLTLQVQGTGLSNAGLVVDSAHGMRLIGAGSSSSSSATYTIRFDSSGAVALQLGGLLCDKNIGSFGCGAVPGAMYTGT